MMLFNFLMNFDLLIAFAHLVLHFEIFVKLWLLFFARTKTLMPFLHLLNILLVISLIPLLVFAGVVVALLLYEIYKLTIEFS